MLVRQVTYVKLIYQVCRSWIPEYMAMVLFDLIFNPIKVCVHEFFSFLAHCIVCNYFCGGSVSLHESRLLCVA